ncbi:MAG: SDR family oxidoreductase [Patescibacteria group bacterium]|nr:SDR family oxidoreductase [Patescibacteria group bacterium]
MSRLLLIGGCGYIGSALHKWLTASGHAVASWDLEWRGNPARIRNSRRDYREANHGFRDYDAVLWFAGHSTVAKCVAEPIAAFHNNVMGLIELANKMNGQPLIYASSGSVYDAAANAKFRNMYDLSKFAADEAIQLIYPNAYALRLGTVCGASPNMRWNTMLNGMVKSAREKRAIEIWHASAHRPLLGMRDLCRAVTECVRAPPPPGIYNLASVETLIGGLGERIADITGAALRVLQRSPGYDFTMNTTKFQEEAGFRFEDTIESMIWDVTNQINSQGRAA